MYSKILVKLEPKSVGRGGNLFLEKSWIRGWMTEKGSDIDEKTGVWQVLPVERRKVGRRGQTKQNSGSKKTQAARQGYCAYGIWQETDGDFRTEQKQKKQTEQKKSRALLVVQQDYRMYCY